MLHLFLGGMGGGVPMIRTIVFVGLYWGPTVFGNYHMGGLLKTMGLWGIRFKEVIRAI